MANDYKIPVVHTWRDGSFSFNGEFDIEASEIGAVVVGERDNINELYELRHLKDKNVTEWGELFHWIRCIDGEWFTQHLGQSREDRLTV
jgi:hypothetical protein